MSDPETVPTAPVTRGGLEIGRDQYRFEVVDNAQRVYNSGAVLPAMEVGIQRLQNGSWETVGYHQVRLQDVLRNEENVEDVAVVTLTRFNPKS